MIGALPPPALLQKLARSRLLAPHVPATTGIGERRSRQKGPGLEFAEHRQYQPGDDIRYLDPHLYGRLGEHFIRQYVVYRQLPIVILIDGSASMAARPATTGQSKFAFAVSLGAALAFIGLSGGDPVAIGVQAEGRLRWSPRVSGAGRAPVLFEWLGRCAAGGTASFREALEAARPHLSAGAMLIMISDFWVDEIEAELRGLAALRQEMLAIHVLSPEEADPAMLGRGEARLVDSESGYEVEVMLDAGTLARYSDALSEWSSTLRRAFARHQGRYLSVRSDQDLERLLLRDWRSRGVIG